MHASSQRTVHTGAMTAGSAISLFSGAGGLDLGVEAAGFAVVSAVEWDDDAADTMEKNAKDVCMAEAKGQEKVAKAELEAMYRPTEKNRREVAEAKADAQYEVAKERCDDQSGDAKDACVKQARAQHVAAKEQSRPQQRQSRTKQ